MKFANYVLAFARVNISWRQFKYQLGDDVMIFYVKEIFKSVNIGMEIGLQNKIFCSEIENKKVRKIEFFVLA